MMIDFITYILIASTFFYLGVEFGKILKPKPKEDKRDFIHTEQEVNELNHYPRTLK